jgi:hypothetical protein
VCPRAADGNAFVQKARTGMEKLSGNTSETSVRLRAQPAILYYKVRKSLRTRARPVLK